MTLMEAALVSAGLCKPAPEKKPEPEECKTCNRRRNDGWCKFRKKFVSRRDVACRKHRKKNNNS